MIPSYGNADAKNCFGCLVPREAGRSDLPKFSTNSEVSDLHLGDLALTTEAVSGVPGAEHLSRGVPKRSKMKPVGMLV